MSKQPASTDLPPRTAAALRAWLIEYFCEHPPRNAPSTILAFLLPTGRMDWMDYLLAFPAMVGRRSGAWSDPAAYSRKHGKPFDAPDQFYLAVTRNLAIKLAKAEAALPRGLPSTIREWLAIKRPKASHSTRKALLLEPNGAGIVKLISNEGAKRSRQASLSAFQLARTLMLRVAEPETIKSRFLECPWDQKNLVELARQAEIIIDLVDDAQRRLIRSELERWAAEYRRAAAALNEYIRYLRSDHFGHIEPMEKREDRLWRFLKCPPHAVTERRQKWLANTDRLLAAVEIFTLPGEEGLAAKLLKVEQLGPGIIRHADVKALFNSISNAAKTEIRKKAPAFGMPPDQAVAHFFDTARGDPHSFKVLPEVFLLSCADPVHWQEEGQEDTLLKDRKEVEGIRHMPDNDFAHRFVTIAARRIAAKYFHDLSPPGLIRDLESAQKAASARLANEPDANRPFRINDDPGAKII